MSMWFDNILVRTLLNFHSPEILEVEIGVLQKKWDSEEKLKKTKLEVPCPALTKDDCTTFQLIDKGNGAEANYDRGGRAVCRIGCQS